MNVPDFGAYDRFRFSFLWLNELLNRDGITLRHGGWPLNDLEKPILDDLSQSSAVVQDECIAYLAKHPEHIPQIHPRKFEAVVACVLRHLGYDVELTPASWDGGKDIIAISRGPIGPLITLVECKRFRCGHKVSVRHVRELLGVMTHDGAERGAIVTSAEYTGPAVQLAASLNQSIALINGSALAQWLSSVANWELGDIKGLLRDPLVSRQQLDSLERYLAN